MGSKEEEENYKVETYIQTFHDGKKRIVVDLFKTTKVKVKSFYINIKPEEFYKT